MRASQGILPDEGASVLSDLSMVATLPSDIFLTRQSEDL